MTVADGDVVTPAALFPYRDPGTTGIQNLAAGIVLDRPPLLGRVADITADPEIRVDWNDGRPSAIGINDFTTTDVYATLNDSLRFVGVAADATVAQFLGRMVHLDSPASQETTGLVVSVFALEAGTTGKAADGAVVTSEVVLFRTRSGQYLLALATSVTVVAGQ